jgi:hypothetical protein
MKVYVPSYSSHAGHWIYKGYQDAWKHLGYDIWTEQEVHPAGACTMTTPLPYTAEELQEEYIIMSVDACVAQNSEKFMEVAAKSYKPFVYVQPNKFPHPWGTHPNFISIAPDNVIEQLNEIDNVYLWTFGDDTTSYHNKWKGVHSIPLAFDSINYKHSINDKYKKFDVCFVGGWANNGFNEKRKIMIDIFSNFKKSELKCAFAIEKNLSHEQETELISSSRVTLNIHDAYQRILGTDTNERTFKTLGLNGCLISDTVGQLNRLFPELETSLDSQEIVEITKQYVQLTDVELNDIKEKNIQNILENHCYTNRVEKLLKL